MTDPAAIAARLTEAQKRALREPRDCSRADFGAFAALHFNLGGKRLWGINGYTPLGSLVLAALDKEPK